jgi:hypothetical protein
VHFSCSYSTVVTDELKVLTLLATQERASSARLERVDNLITCAILTCLLHSSPYGYRYCIRLTVAAWIEQE